MAAKSARTSRAMDVVHAKPAAPSTTSRPVLVRSYLQPDPMLAADSPPAHGVPTKLGAPAIGDVAVSLEAAVEVPVNSDIDHIHAPKAPKAAGAALSSSDPQTRSGSQVDNGSVRATAGSIAKRGSNASADTAGLDDTASDSAAERPDDQVESADPVDRQAELEGLIAAGTYAVPIDSVHRRRMLGTLIVLTCIAVLLVLDILLDMELIHLPFALPHTSFL